MNLLENKYVQEQDAGCNLVSGVSPSHSADSGIDDRDPATIGLLAAIDEEMEKFTDFEQMLANDDFLDDEFWNGGPSDTIGNYDASFLPLISVPKSVSTSSSLSTSSVELDHSYGVPAVSKEDDLASKLVSIEEIQEPPVQRKDMSVTCTSSRRDKASCSSESFNKEPEPKRKGFSHTSLDVTCSEADTEIERSCMDAETPPTVDRSRKNAENARLNRQRKKRYVENLEREIKSLRSSNAALMGERKGLKDQVKDLKGQVDCLKGVLANESTLASVMKAISSVPGLKINNGLKNSVVAPRSSKRLRQSEARSDRVKQAKHGNTEATRNMAFKNDKSSERPADGGICLHVKNDVISLALCSACADSADGAQ